VFPIEAVEPRYAGKSVDKGEEVRRHDFVATKYFLCKRHSYLLLDEFTLPGHER
jgi:hypothetical protein